MPTAVARKQSQQQDTPVKLNRNTREAKALGLRKADKPHRGGPAPKLIVPGAEPLPVSTYTGFKLTEKQLEAHRLLRGLQRHTLLVGGSRSGKTFELVRAVVVRALRGEGSRHAILRLHALHAKQSIWLDTLPKVFKLCFPTMPVELKESYGYVQFPNQAQIWVGGLDDKERVERILGQEHSTLFFNECSQLPYASVMMALTRLAQKVDGLRNRAYYDLNPVGTGHWTSKLFLEHKKPDTLEALGNPDEYKFMYMNPEDNRDNIDPAYIEELKNLPERMRRRFYEGRYVAQLDGALWTLETVELYRVQPEEVPPLRRIVVAVDPSGASGEFDIKADQIGIVTVGLGVDGRGYVLEDNTGWYSPENWGRVVCNAYFKYGAERVVAEKNFGGDMVRAIIHGVDPNVSYKEVTASRGKVIRAEPMAALYEQGKVSHVGRFALMEDEMTNFTTAGYLGSGSPNRADALVWALTELFPTSGTHGLLDLWISQSEQTKYGARKTGEEKPGLIALDHQTKSGFSKAFSEGWLKKSPAANAAAQPIVAAPANTSIPTLVLSDTAAADAQKEGADFMTGVTRLGKVATTNRPPQTDGCPKCGNKFVSRFSDTFKCGACGTSGPNSDLQAIRK